ncbi:hypothetical protein OG564_10935 [Streptomyces sp. NBC_01280]|uniref:hypothetical protein n=1 Tax=Streptomyces sp. NBC_01280 TaxID=2903810 RepID=UPI002E37058B|nr:hypothetical protein [Streptomyces sp. NBC_01280]
MINLPSRVRGTAKAPSPATSSPPAGPAGPGEQVVHDLLGPEANQRLRTQAQGDGLHAVLAQLILETAREADRLHGRLRLQASYYRDRLTEALDDRRATAFIPVSGLLGPCGHSTDLLAARCAQQLNQLGLVLDAYRTAHPTTS